MFDNIFQRVWYVPEGSKNEEEAFKALSTVGITPEVKAVHSKVGRLEGYILTFNCVPGIYHTMKMACKGGNKRIPLEWVPGK